MSGAPPLGKLAVAVTCLEMVAPPVRPPMPAPLAKLALIHAERPTLSYYRYLFRAVGAPWLWADRLRMGDDALTARIQDARTALYVLYEAGVPAGFGELYARDAETTEIVYFGMMPENTGRRLGPYLLDHIVRIAWMGGPQRLEVETCTLDHPRALQTYQRAGFVAYRRETVFRNDPRLLGLVPEDAAPRVPLARPRPETPEGARSSAPVKPVKPVT